MKEWKLIEPIEGKPVISDNQLQIPVKAKINKTYLNLENAQVTPQEQIQAMYDKMDQIYNVVSIIQKNPKDVIFDSFQLMQILNISKSTLQKLRVNGVIGYSKVLGKHFYRQSDINDMIEKNYKPAFR